MARLLWVFVIVNSFLLSQSQTDEFVYRGFKPSSAATNNNTNISPTRAAKVSSNGLLVLTTTASAWQIGRAFYPKPINFKNSATGKPFSFSTAFAFSIVPKYPDSGGHGFAFVISPQMELPGATPNQYLGLFNLSNNGNSSNHIFAVEFDTVVDVDFKDISDNHVGIDLNGLTSINSGNASYFSDRGKKTNLRLASGKTIQASVDYDSNANVVNVYLSLSSRKPETPIMSTPVDLSPILLETMFVGFSASTGQLTSSQFIRGWSFKMNGQAKSLDLDSLPRIPRKHDKNGLIIGVSVSAVVAVIVCSIGMVFYIKLKRFNDEEIVEDWEVDIGPNRFSYKDLLQATRGFSDDEILGFGGFGRVYKGTLPNLNTQIAVKRISKESKQGLREFVSEIASMGRLRHRNLVHLLGWCRKGVDLLLVYDFMPNGSLDKYLFDEPKLILSWTQRFKIIKDVASGLLYLHEEWEQTVIHRDIKAGNVLLDTEMNGRLGDFGLAKLYEHGSNPSTTRVVGTLGYLAPELTRLRKPTTSSDVYAFGALLLEVVCGRRPIEAKALPEELILVEWVWEKWTEGAVLAAVDQRLGTEYDEIEAVMVLKLGLMCSNSVPGKRPSMRQVVRYLEGEVALPEVIEQPDEFCKADGGGSGELECVVHSYPSSVSGLERARSWLLAPENDTIDIEAQVASSNAMSLWSEMNREDSLSN